MPDDAQLSEAAQRMVDEAYRRAREASPDYDDRPHVGSFVAVGYAAGFSIEHLTECAHNMAGDPETSVLTVIGGRDLAERFMAESLIELQDLYEKEQASM